MRLVSKEAAKRKPAEQQAIQTYFRAKMTNLTAAPRAMHWQRLEKERKDYYDSMPKVIVSKSATKKRVVRILPRGNWMVESGEVVHAALPHFLPQPKIEGREPTRLDLAEWLVSRQNPLTARAVMNRLWQQFFGDGLSRVLDDLGAQGEPPANPALLDWLACEFMDSGWDMKHMVRMIVTSQTYRQTSTAPARTCRRPIPSIASYARQSCYPTRCGISPRQRAFHFRPAFAKDRRAKREAVSARQVLGQPELPAARLRCRPGRKPISPRHVHLAAAHVSRIHR